MPQKKGKRQRVSQDLHPTSGSIKWVMALSVVDSRAARCPKTPGNNTPRCPDCEFRAAWNCRIVNSLVLPVLGRVPHHWRETGETGGFGLFWSWFGRGKERPCPCRTRTVWWIVLCYLCPVEGVFFARRSVVVVRTVSLRLDSVHTVSWKILRAAGVHARDLSTSPPLLAGTMVLRYQGGSHPGPIAANRPMNGSMLKTFLL